MRFTPALLTVCVLSFTLGCGTDDSDATTQTDGGTDHPDATTQTDGGTDHPDATTQTDGGTNCSPSLGTSPAACPESTEAEAAFTKVETDCAIVEDDFDLSNPDSPTLTSDGAAKICGICDCEQAVFDYYTQYKNCTGSDESNTAFAKNMYDLANGC